MNSRVAWTGAIALGLVLGGRVAVAAEATASGLAEYVAKADSSYGWVKRREGTIGATEFVELTLTSQTWQGVVWKHQLYVLKPAQVEAKQALLFIGGGRWRDELAAPVEGDNGGLPREAYLLAAAAQQMRTPVAVLLHVPQQPMFGNMVEDQIISYTFVQYFLTRNPEWPLLCPMVKSAVRAMDAIQEFARQDWSLEITGFTLSGASKRGWTTWLTSAVDRRVTALAPMVIDMLNMEPQMKHQVASFGGFSEQIGDYTEKGLHKVQGPIADALRALVDPYSYRAVITQPKLIMLGTNDRYWPLDAANLYWDGLQGEKYLLYVPNRGHDLGDMERVVGGLAALQRMAAGGERLPKLDWQLEPNERGLGFELRVDRKPARVQVWTASAPTRDFREARWTAQTIEPVDGVYRYELPAPQSGFAAMFGEAMFNGEGPKYYLSTNVKILGAKQAAGAGGAK